MPVDQPGSREYESLQIEQPEAGITILRLNRPDRLNALIPAAERATSGISVALDTGRHTTTHARLYHLDDNSRIIDSPGMQEFGLHHIDRDALAWGFVEFRQYMGRCRFNNCRHANEPECALAQAVQEGKISARRFAFYQKLAK